MMYLASARNNAPPTHGVQQPSTTAARLERAVIFPIVGVHTLQGSLASPTSRRKNRVASDEAGDEPGNTNRLVTVGRRDEVRPDDGSATANLRAGDRLPERCNRDNHQND